MLWQAEYVNSKVKHFGGSPRDEDTYISAARGKGGNLKCLHREYLLGFLFPFLFLKGKTAVTVKPYTWIKPSKSGLMAEGSLFCF